MPWNVGAAAEFETYRVNTIGVDDHEILISLLRAWAKAPLSMAKPDAEAKVAQGHPGKKPAVPFLNRIVRMMIFLKRVTTYLHHVKRILSVIVHHALLAIQTTMYTILASIFRQRAMAASALGLVATSAFEGH